ncbi:MAG: response regulator [Chitinophagaceae bacterium]|nr:response regulator [Chitinophagaceae bacterium]
MKILMIDDDTDLLEVTEALLAKKGFEVAAHTNWEDALNKIEGFQPQLILLDVFLNGIDGLDICKQLKSMPHTKHIPVLIFSAYPSIAERVIYEYGADDFIAKPFEVNDLITKMHSVLSQTAGLA